MDWRLLLVLASAASVLYASASSRHTLRYDGEVNIGKRKQG
jgi:hypothetical protein